LTFILLSPISSEHHSSAVDPRKLGLHATTTLPPDAFKFAMAEFTRTIRAVAQAATTTNRTSTNVARRFRQGGQVHFGGFGAASLIPIFPLQKEFSVFSVQFCQARRLLSAARRASNTAH
jgi:hypothetical protein